jgi:hypothetical protein
MKMRIAFLIGFLVGAWGCGKSDTVTGPPPPPPPQTVTPVVTPVHLGPTPTPHCANFKVCEGQGYGPF